jgi:hypothetical protein
MQVLVLAAQNAVDYGLLGVATSGTTLFRQVGGSIGVSVFGAIFTNELGRELAHRLPAGAHAPTHASPAAIQHLPPAIHALYIATVSVALHPVFLAAAAVMVVAFGLSWLLHDVPLRKTAGAPGVGATYAAPRVASIAGNVSGAEPGIPSRPRVASAYVRRRARARTAPVAALPSAQSLGDGKSGRY